MYKTTFAGSLTLLAAALASAGAAAAEETADLDAVSVTAEVLKTDVDPEKTPQTVSIINRESLEERNVRKLDDSLAYTAGFLNPYGVDFDTNWIRMRGFAVTTLIDGMTQWQEGYFDSAVEPYGVEAVEVISGPASSLYGDSMPGGVVNVVTKKPTKKPQHSIMVTGGSQSLAQVGLDYSDFANEDGSQRFRIVAMASREDSQLNGVNGSRVYVAPSYTIDFSDRTTLTLMASYTKDDRIPNNGFFPAIGTVVPRNGRYIARSTNYGDPEHDDYNRDQITAGWELSHAFSDHLSYKQKFAYRYNSLHLRSTAAYGSFDTTEPSDGGLYRGTLLNYGTEQSYTFDNNLTYTNKKGDFDYLLQAGFDLQHHENNWHGNGLGEMLANADPFEPSHTGMPSDDELTVWGNEITKKQLGLYTQGQTVWNETVLLKGGLRWDQVEIDASNDNAAALNSGDSLDDGHLSWNLGAMLYTPLGLSPYVNYSEAFYTNASLASIYDASTAKYAYRLYEPIETKQIEVGLKYAPDWLDGTINLAFFKIKQKNAYAQAIVNGTLATLQTGEKESKGIELSLDAALTDMLSLRAAFTWQDVTVPSYSDYSGTSRTLAEFAPETFGSVWVSYRFADLGLPGLTIGTGLRYLGSMRDTYYRWKTDDATLWDASASYRFDSHWKAVVSATNITDETYVAGVNYNTAYYGEGRTIRASLTYSW